MYRYHDKPSDETEPSTAEQLKIAYVQNTERWVHQGRNMTGQSMSQYQEIGRNTSRIAVGLIALKMEMRLQRHILILVAGYQVHRID